ncbi:MAG: hypothetical protein MRJ52_03690 [Nitrosomonas sp.]|jgi:hypothetical protein|nr:hypothetical protein [Nitrosomonas sp.]
MTDENRRLNLMNWQSLSLNTRRFLNCLVAVALIVIVGAQFHVSSQGDLSQTYPKGYRGGTCTIESDTMMIGYSAYFISDAYEVPEDALSALSVPVLCGKVPNPGILDISIDLLYPESLRNIPLALHMERIAGENGQQRLLTLPPQQFKSGSIIQVVSLDEAGQYVLTLEGIDPEINQQFTVQIPIKVGTSWLDTVVEFWPLFLLFAIALIIFNIEKILNRFSVKR